MDELPHTDEHWLAMAALDRYPIDDMLPKSTSVVFRIDQLGHAWQAALDALTQLYEETADYIRVNNLGDIHHNRSMQLARDVIAQARWQPPHISGRQMR